MTTYIANKQIRTPKITEMANLKDTEFYLTERGQALPEGVYDEATIKAWLKRGLIYEQGRSPKATKPVLASEDPKIVPGKSRQDEDEDSDETEAVAKPKTKAK